MMATSFHLCHPLLLNLYAHPSIPMKCSIFYLHSLALLVSVCTLDASTKRIVRPNWLQMIWGVESYVADGKLEHIEKWQEIEQLPLKDQELILGSHFWCRPNSSDYFMPLPSNLRHVIVPGRVVYFFSVESYEKYELNNTRNDEFPVRILITNETESTHNRLYSIMRMPESEFLEVTKNLNLPKHERYGFNFEQPEFLEPLLRSMSAYREKEGLPPVTREEDIARLEAQYKDPSMYYTHRISRVGVFIEEFLWNNGSLVAICIYASPFVFISGIVILVRHIRKKRRSAH